MANAVFATEISGVSADLTTANVLDDTNYANQGISRNTLALVLFLYKRDASSNDTNLPVSNANPLTVNSWLFNLPSQDGLFVCDFYGFIIWTAGTYSQNSCVYYAGAYYYVNNPSGTSQIPGGSDWTLIPLANIPTVIAGLSPAPLNLSHTQTYNFSTPRIQTGILADAEATLGEQIINGICKNWAQAAGVITGGALLDSAYTNFAKQNYSGAQGIVDYLQATTQLPI